MLSCGSIDQLGTVAQKGLLMCKVQDSQDASLTTMKICI